MAASRRPAASPSVRLRIDFGRDESVGPGKISLLEQIAATGSLSQAARELKMSYRRAWQLLDNLNNSFAEPSVLTQKGGRGGGGARLTPFGRELVALYRAFDMRVQQLAVQTFRPLVPRAARRGAKRARPAVRRLSRR
jgi:molybdate transport system regulatory protein